jgi:hypothetical protein
MGRSTLIAVAAALLAVAAVASHSCSNNPNQTISQPDGGQVCNFANLPCSGGFSCVNGICAQRCPAGTPCPSGSYCEGDAGFDEVCAPITTTVCADSTQCPAPQVCSFGLCVSGELLGDGGKAACSLTPPNDGCAPGALCFANGGASSCVGMPACSQDGTCPAVGEGSTCNVRPDGGRLLAGKQRICLLGFCTGPTDCPANLPHCVNSGTNIENSGCFAGRTGDPCTSNADCASNKTCAIADGGVLGTCP